MKTNNIVIGVLLVIVLFLLCKPCMCNENYNDPCRAQCSKSDVGCQNYVCNKQCGGSEGWFGGGGKIADPVCVQQCMQQIWC